MQDRIMDFDPHFISISKPVPDPKKCIQVGTVAYHPEDRENPSHSVYYILNEKSCPIVIKDSGHGLKKMWQDPREFELILEDAVKRLEFVVKNDLEEDADG